MNIRTIVEQRLKAYLLLDTSITYQVLLGQDSTEESVPAVIVYAPTANPIDLGVSNFGNFTVDVEVHIYTSRFDNTLDDHRAMMSKVEANLQDSVALGLFWGSENGVMYLIDKAPTSEARDENKWGNLLRYSVTCCLPVA